MSNSASALHVLLSDFRGISGSPGAAWASVLGANYGSAEFVLRHTEVVGLLREVIKYTDTLSASSQERYSKYQVKWWEAIVAAQNGMGTNSPATLISESEIDHLAGLGEFIENSLASTVAMPGPIDLSELRSLLVEWETVLPGIASLRDESRRVLLAQIQHVIWLIDNSATYGVSRVVAEAQGVTTAVATASPEVTDPGQQASWADRLKRLYVAVCVASTTAFGVATPALEQGARLLEQANQVVEQAADLADGPDARGGTGSP